MPKRDPETLMWDRAQALIDQAERMHRQFFRRACASLRPPAWEPPVDVLETADELWLLVALPGVRADRVEVRVEDDALVVRGVRTLPAAFRDAEVHRLEIPQGLFERRIPLPAGRYELTRRELDSGCLSLTLRKLGITR